MDNFLKIERFSFGVGDRFAHQAEAQLRACMKAAGLGAEIVPVWNKSNREHLTIGSEPSSTRAAAAAAVKALGWTMPWRVDADHIRLETVDRFIPHSDFFTIDVADWIGKPASADSLREFVSRHPELAATITMPGVQTINSSSAELGRIAAKYLLAVQEAGKICRHILNLKGPGAFITEVSMDETDSPQTPPELLIILAALADEGVPVQTIAPKFSGRFNKGVDYVGDLSQFEREFVADISVIEFAVKKYGLPSTLKLSIHSGSDKFSIYGPIRRALACSGAGLHIKTAGTTWLEEVIGLAEAGGGGLELAKEIYAGALEHRDELCAPYATVIDINPAKLPPVAQVKTWDSKKFVGALRHNKADSAYNPHLRQLIHVGYKIAAKMGDRYIEALKANSECVSRNVTLNLFDRHIKPLFLQK